MAEFLKDYKKECVLSPLFKMLEAIFELLVPVVMARMIDIGIAGNDMHYIVKMGILLVSLALIGLACAVSAQYFAAKASVGFGTGLRHALFQHINTLSHKEIDETGTSILVTRMTSDINQLQNCVNLVLRLFLRSPFIVFGSMIMAFTIDVKEALVFVVAIPLLSIVVFGIMLITMPLYKKVQAKLERVLLLTRECLAGDRVVRAFNRQQDEMEKFHEENEMLLNAQQFVGKISALLNPLTYIIVNVAIVVLIWSGAWRVQTGVITQGALVALINYMNQVLVELVKLANLIVTITKALACKNRVNALFEVKTSVSDAERVWTKEEREKEQKEKGAVRFEHVSFSYSGSKAPVLSDMTFDARPGEVIGVIGGTGAGKSSLIQLIPRFYDVQDGAVFVDGMDVRDYAVEDLRGKIGVVPQKAVLFRGSIRENMTWGNKDADDQAILEALDISQALEFVQQKGLDYKLTEGGNNLSGGQKQRLTIARAVVKKPEILILDDSASALDFATDKRLRTAIANRLQCTMFLISQRVTTVMGANKILVLDDGKIVGQGTHEELFDNCKIYHEICLSQLSESEVKSDGKEE